MATSRFVRDYDSAQLLLRACAHGALGDLCRAFEQGPRFALRRYNKVKGLEPTVLEIDIGGGPRMLVHWNAGTLYLLALGSHEIVSHYKSSARVHDEINKCRALPARITQMLNVGFFTFDVEKEWETFANEADPAWLMHLDTQQSSVVTRILKRTFAPRSNKEWNFSLITGGPGTGKTSILLNVWHRAWEEDVVPQFVMEDQVAEYIKTAVGLDLDPYRCTLYEASQSKEGGILLVDDPYSSETIEQAKWLAQKRKFRAVIVGVDPLQLSGDFDDSKLKTVLSGIGSELYSLNICYRQKEIVGAATKRAIEAVAASSPFLSEEKKFAFADSRKRITSLVNNLEFANPAGRFKKYPSASVNDVKREVGRLLKARGLWKHWNPYLIAFDDEGLGQIPAAWKKVLAELSGAYVLPLSHALQIKGVEFQHALLILSESLFLQLEAGFEGSTRRVYDARRLLRIPISRAKDSVTVFVKPGTD